MPFEFHESPDFGNSMRELKDIYRTAPTGTLSNGQVSIEVVKLSETRYATVDPVDDATSMLAQIEGITIRHLERRPALPQRSRPERRNWERKR